jgi:Na+/melibiose symporter-like transporter
MRWESQRRYRARPYLALGVGLAALLTGLTWALVTGHWEDWHWALVALGLTLLVYGAVMVQVRQEYRRASKWYRENHGP